MKPAFEDVHGSLIILSDTGLCWPPTVSVTDEGTTIHVSLVKGTETHFDFDRDDKLVAVRED